MTFISPAKEAKNIAFLYKVKEEILKNRWQKEDLEMVTEALCMLEELIELTRQSKKISLKYYFSHDHKKNMN